MQRAETVHRRQRSPAEKIDIELALVCPWEIGRLALDAHIGLDADLRPHGGNGKADLFVSDIAVVGAGEAGLEAVRIAGFRQQRLGLGDVVRQRYIDVLVVAGHCRCDEHAGRAGLAAHQALLDGVGVDRVPQRLAHAHIAQRIGLAWSCMQFRPVAKDEEDGAQRRVFDDLQTVGGRNAVDVLQRNRRNHVDLT
ncbi:hypothetical protein D9M72_411360 [compost metagenome]